MARPTERKLAAIMFLDMVGYTRLMQENEAEAVAKRDRHREVLRREVAEHGGEILQYWGDGTLCLFNSAVEAVHCAADIQRAMQEPPEIPLRIGIHLGDVAQDEEGLYGDGVNIAARIESLSVPGAVLVSKKVRDEVKNQADFSCRSMGVFTLKNVAEPLELYAVEAAGLTMPNSRELKGKGGRYPFWRPKSRKQWVLSSILALLLFGGLAYGGNRLFNRGEPNPEALPAEVREERLAIMPLENLTGDPELDFISEYLRDALTIGFGKISGPELVPPESVERYWENPEESSGDLEGNPSFTKMTGAQYLLQGKYYQQGSDSLLFNMFLMDAVSGKVVKSFPETTASLRDKKAMANKVSAHVLGFWTFYKTDISKYTIDINEDMATYEAAKAYEEGMKYYLLDNDKALHYFKRAEQLDSTFGAPKSFIADIYFNRLAPKKVMDSMLVREEWRSPMGLIHRKVFTAQSERNARSVMRFLGMFRKLIPEEQPVAIHYAFASISAGYPLKAIEALEPFVPKLEDQIHLLPFDYNLLAWLSYGYNLTGQEEKTLALLDRYEFVSSRSSFLHGNIIRAMVREGETDALDQYIEANGFQSLNIGYAPFYLHWQAAWESALMGKDDQVRKYAGRALDELEQLPVEEREWFPPYCHLLLGNLKEAEQGFIQLGNAYPAEFRYQAMLGIVYTRMVEQSNAQRYLVKMKEMKEDDWGFKQYWVATLQAQLGQKEAAVQSLEIALDKGARFVGEGCPYPFWNMFQNDVFLKPLVDDKPFQELVEPEG